LVLPGDQFKSAGTTVVFDPNMRYKLWSAHVAREVLLQVARKCDVLLPSLDEAKILSGLTSIEDMAVALLQLGPKKVAIKAGDKGSYFVDNETRGFVPPFRVRGVDPIGAGDAYCAGVISGLLDNLTFREAVERGCAMGAICGMSYGDYAAPDRQELESFLAGTGTQAR
jgi:2-dehydro-3-deoxygluconokinase